MLDMVGLLIKFIQIISFKPSKWLGKCISFITQKQKQAEINLKKTSTNYLITHLMEKQWKMYEIVGD